MNASRADTECNALARRTGTPSMSEHRKRMMRALKARFVPALREREIVRKLNEEAQARQPGVGKTP